MREPNARHLAAIEAALLPPDGARDAWERLRQHSNFLDETDIATFRMLPMVYRNLRTAGLAEADLGPLKGIYRQYWLRTRITLRAAESVTAILRAAGIEPVALKGLGLLAKAYPEAALRPMHDLDFLFRAGGFTRAVDALLAAGWKPLRGTRADYFRRLKVFHALPLVGPGGLEIDLHRYMLEENCYRDADAPVFERLASGKVGDLEVTMLGPEDQVINACVHGVRWDPTPPLRWVADAVMVLRAAAGEFDWEYLVAESRRRGVSLGMAAALEFARRFEPTIPHLATELLRGAKSGWLERRDFRFQQGGDGVPMQVGRYVTRYTRLAAHRSAYRKLADFPTYLEAMWELENRRQVPWEGVRRITGRAWKGKFRRG